MNTQEENLGQVLEIGDHCSVEYCGQIDFLPFKCDCCNRTFCLEHRSYVAHSCPNAGAKETTVIVCPICAKGMRLKPGQNPSEAFDVHQRTDCDPANYDRVHKKPRCPVNGCKEKLTTINAYRCKHCSQRVCLRHRDPRDHKCGEAQAALRQQRVSTCTPSSKNNASGRTSAGSNSPAPSRPSTAPRAANGSALGPATSSSSTAAAAVAAPSGRPQDIRQLHTAAVRQYEDPANSVRGTAARRQQLALEAAQQQQQQSSFFQWPWQQQQQQPAPPPSAAPATAAPVAASSATTTTTTNTTTTTRNLNDNGNNASNANPLIPPHRPEVCPQCGASFATVERLVQHVEDFHPTEAAIPGGAAPAPVFTNPLQSLLEATTIAGGEAPPAAPGTGLLYSGTGSGGGVGGGAGGVGEVFRCYFCSRTFHDPVLLVQHSDRCAAGRRGAGSRAGGGGGRGGSSGSAGGGSKESCSIC